MIKLLTLVGGLATEWFQGKREESKAKQEAKIAAIKSVENWDAIQAQGSQNSWRDEWFVLVLSIPMIGAFIPSLVPYIQTGFTVLDEMPDYYKAFLAAAIASSFGVKALTSWKK